MANKFVAVKINGIVSVHLPHTNGNYYTLCGLDGSDEYVGQEIVDVPIGAKVDCTDCLHIWEVCKLFTARDFVAPNKA